MDSRILWTDFRHTYVGVDDSRKSRLRDQGDRDQWQPSPFRQRTSPVRCNNPRETHFDGATAR